MHVDGQPVRSCSLPLGQVSGAVTTIEGIGTAAGCIPCSRHGWRKHVAQCGYCQAGQIMSAVALLDEVADPSDADIDNAMGGNLCRCGTYPQIRSAIKKAAALKTAGL